MEVRKTKRMRPKKVRFCARVICNVEEGALQGATGEGNVREGEEFCPSGMNHGSRRLEGERNGRELMSREETRMAKGPE
jgi:hypothetical protein